MPIYDFMADLGQLKENYESYDDKRKKQYENLKETIVPQLNYSENRDINTINETDNFSNVPQGSIDSSKGIGMLSDIFKMSDSKKETPLESSSFDGSTIQLSDNQLNDKNSGWSNPEVAKDFKMGNEVANNESSAIGSLLGSEGTNQATSTINFGMDLFQNSKQESGSVEESAMNTLNTTIKGAQAGVSLGGPWGAAIGGTVGLTAGLLDLEKDKNSRHKKYKLNYNDMLEAGITRREQEQKQKDGEQSLAALTELRKAQLNYIS